jgi:hypothetical protein
VKVCVSCSYSVKCCTSKPYKNFKLALVLERSETVLKNVKKISEVLALTKKHSSFVFVREQSNGSFLNATERGPYFAPKQVFKKMNKLVVHGMFPSEKDHLPIRTLKAINS